MSDPEPKRTHLVLVWLVVLMGIVVVLTGGATAYFALRRSLSSGSTEQMAFVAGTWGEQLNLYLADSHGESRESLSQSRGDKLFPAWSPDGNKLAYCRTSLFGNAGGGGPSGAPNSAGAYLLDMSSDSDQERPRSEALYTTEDGLAYYPAWSPDGKRIALLSISMTDQAPATTITQTKLVLVDVATREAEEHPLSLSVTGKGLTWSADGSLLALVGEEPDTTGGVYVYNLGSATLTRIAATASDVAWSPNEMLLACANLNGKNGLVLLNAAGERVRTLESDAQVTGLTWSPDGTQLVYGRLSGNSYDLALCNVETGETEPVATSLEGTPMYLSWSPSGAYVAYTVIASNSDEVTAWIEVLDMRTLKSVAFLSEEAIECMAIWQPSNP